MRKASMHNQEKSIDLAVPESPVPEACNIDADKKQLLLTYESKCIDAKKQAKDGESVFFFPSDNVAVVEVREENPKAAISTPVRCILLLTSDEW